MNLLPGTATVPIATLAATALSVGQRLGSRTGLSAICLSAFTRAPFSSCAQLTGLDHDRAGTGIPAELDLNRRDDLRQVRADELAAVVFGHVLRKLRTEKRLDRFPRHADGSKFPFDPYVDQRVVPACADRIIFHALPLDALTNPDQLTTAEEEWNGRY